MSKAVEIVLSSLNKAVARPVMAAVVGLVCLAICPALAFAHAFLIGTQPEDNATLEQSPSEIVLRFNEPLTSARLELIDASGEVIIAKALQQPLGDTLALTVPMPLAHGVYRARYRVTSGDGHPVTGHIQFGMGVAPDPAAASGENRRLQAASVLVRAAYYIAMLTGLGGGLFLWRVFRHGSTAPPAAVQRGLAALAVMAAAFALLLIGLTGTVLSGGQWADLMTLPVWSAGARTTVAQSAGVVVLGACLTLAGLVQPATRRGRVLLVIGALMVPLSLAVTGHVAGASSRGLGSALVFLHGIAAAFWVGSLWPLVVMLRSSAPETSAHPLLQPFSRLAPLAVVMLVLTGVGMSVLQGIVSAQALTDTLYGQIWLAKVCLVVVLTGIALWNRRVLTPAIQRGRADAMVRLRRHVLAELVLVAMIVSLSAGFSTTPPPRARQDVVPTAVDVDTPRGYSTVANVNGWTVLVDVQPAGVGDNQVDVVVSRSNPAAVPVTLVSEWQRAGSGSPEPALRVRHDQNAMANVVLPEAGRWQVLLRWEDASGHVESTRITIPVTPRLAQ